MSNGEKSDGFDCVLQRYCNIDTKKLLNKCEQICNFDAGLTSFYDCSRWEFCLISLLYCTATYYFIQ